MTNVIARYFALRAAGLRPADAWECALLEARYEVELARIG